MLLALLAVFSACAAVGMRIALPLLVIGLLQTDQWWSNIPLLALLHPQVVLAILTSWSLFELFASKKLLGQRVMQIIQLVTSPVVGALMAVSINKIAHLELEPLWLITIIGGVLALVLKLVEVGWFFRLRGIPLWIVCLEDILCVLLVLFAFEAPQQGGIIAMLLLWLAIRSSNGWRDWYKNKQLKSKWG